MSEPTQVEIAGFPGLYAEAEGERRPLPLVFLHGMWAHHEFFHTYLRFFSTEGFDCYAVSRRGRKGVPPTNAQGVGFQDYLDDTLSTLDAIGREVIVVGWSLGGLVAQKVAEAGRCQAAVLVAPVAPGDVRTLPRLGALPFYLRRLPDMLLGRPFLPSYGHAVRLFLGRIPEADRRLLYDAVVPDSGTVGRQIALTGVRVDVSQVRCPMLCVVGVDDNATPARSVRRIAAKYDADLREYPNHAHMLMEEPGWEGIASDMLAWLDAALATITFRE